MVYEDGKPPRAASEEMKIYLNNQFLKSTNMDDKLTAQFRIPTEQYGYIEIGYTGTPKEIKSKYEEVLGVIKGSSGVSEFDFCACIKTIVDSDLTIWGTVDDYNLLNDNQKSVLQSLKRFVKRKANQD